MYKRQVSSNILPPKSCIWRFPLKLSTPPSSSFLPIACRVEIQPPDEERHAKKEAETETEKERKTLTPKNRIHLPERWCTRRGSRALSSSPTRSRLAALEPRGKKKKKRAKNRKERGRRGGRGWLIAAASVLAVVRVPPPSLSPPVTNVDRVRGRGDKTRSCLGAWRRWRRVVDGRMKEIGTSRRRTADFSYASPQFSLWFSLGLQTFFFTFRRKSEHRADYSWNYAPIKS